MSAVIRRACRHVRRRTRRQSRPCRPVKRLFRRQSRACTPVRRLFRRQSRACSPCRGHGDAGKEAVVPQYDLEHGEQSSCVAETKSGAKDWRRRALKRLHDRGTVEFRALRRAIDSESGDDRGNRRIITAAPWRLRSRDQHGVARQESVLSRDRAGRRFHVRRCC